MVVVVPLPNGGWPRVGEIVVTLVEIPRGVVVPSRMVEGVSVMTPGRPVVVDVRVGGGGKPTLDVDVVDDRVGGGGKPTLDVDVVDDRVGGGGKPGLVVWED